MKKYVLLLTIALFISCAEKEPLADMIITGGDIYTADKNTPVVEAVAVINDKIVYAGDLSGIEKFKGERTLLIDLQGKTMTPGFIEGACAFFWCGLFRVRSRFNEG